jgi:hypothetical protein
VRFGRNGEIVDVEVEEDDDNLSEPFGHVVDPRPPRSV